MYENTTKLLVPTSSLLEREPSKFPVFFNPAAKFNRDISIHIYNAFLNTKRKREDISFVDSMSGSGARGIRVANEIQVINKVYINDSNSFSVLLSKINAVLNNVYDKCNFFNKEICSFLSYFSFEQRATIVDVDPFGTPAPYLDCLLRAVENGGIISVTATDTAVLCGVYPKVCYRKYYGNPLRTKYSSEIGIRLLMSSIALIASRMDLSVIPIFCHGYRNYVRVYCQIQKSSCLANKIQEKLGYVIHCFNCGNRSMVKKPFNIANCNACNFRPTVGGPLWTSGIFDKNMIRKTVESLVETDNMLDKPPIFTDNLKSFFTVALNELDSVPYHYVNDEIGKIMKKNVVSIDKIIGSLKKNGYIASTTIFAANGFKTNASIMDIEKIVYQNK